MAETTSYKEGFQLNQGLHLRADPEHSDANMESLQMSHFYLDKSSIFLGASAVVQARTPCHSSMDCMVFGNRILS